MVSDLVACPYSALCSGCLGTERALWPRRRPVPLEGTPLLIILDAHYEGSIAHVKHCCPRRPDRHFLSSWEPPAHPAHPQPSPSLSDDSSILPAAVAPSTPVIPGSPSSLAPLHPACPPSFPVPSSGDIQNPGAPSRVHGCPQDQATIVSALTVAPTTSVPLEQGLWSVWLLAAAPSPEGVSAESRCSANACQ